MLKGSCVWSSSDEEIATVDENSVVTALKEGNSNDQSIQCSRIRGNLQSHCKGKAEQPDVDQEAPTAR